MWKLGALCIYLGLIQNEYRFWVAKESLMAVPFGHFYL